MNTPTVSWTAKGIKLIDQTCLPRRYRVIYCRDVSSLRQAIRQLSVRGAPAIGVAAGFGMALAARRYRGKDPRQFRRYLQRAADTLASARPTAVNLFHVIREMSRMVDENPGSTVAEHQDRLLKKAQAIYEDDRAVCRAMGRHGAPLIRPDMGVMTICNAGALATVDYGTALGVIYRAFEEGRRFQVYACETRPLLQGARLTTWELQRAGVDTTLITDNMAATVMQQGRIQLALTGADRIAANGDTANKIGTYGLAVLARHHGIPFYIAAPFSTFDLSLDDGRAIPIEERAADEVSSCGGVRTAPRGCKVYNPAFDVTPTKLISGIVTERGIIRPVSKATIRAMSRKI